MQGLTCHFRGHHYTIALTGWRGGRLISLKMCFLDSPLLLLLLTYVLVFQNTPLLREPDHSAAVHY